MENTRFVLVRGGFHVETRVRHLLFFGACASEERSASEATKLDRHSIVISLEIKNSRKHAVKCGCRTTFAQLNRSQWPTSRNLLGHTLRLGATWPVTLRFASYVATSGR